MGVRRVSVRDTDFTDLFVMYGRLERCERDFVADFCYCGEHRITWRGGRWAKVRRHTYRIAKIYPSGRVKIEELPA